MRKIRYFIEFIIIKFIFFVFKILGYKLSSNLGAFVGKTFGPLFRKKNLILNNLIISKIAENDKKRNNIVSEMWGNYGRILSEYPFIKDFDNNKLSNYLYIEGQDIIERLKKNNENVIFVSGHFSNFELMAMHLENSGIKLAAIYRPLNNIFLNKTMEKIRKKYICKTQIKKGKSGTREIVKLIKNGYSIALMIDQRVTEGILCKFFDREAFTTSIPAQTVKKYHLRVVPVHIERLKNYYFKIKISDPISFSDHNSIHDITYALNNQLEIMIKKNPNQWIWSHNRWKR